MVFPQGSRQGDGRQHSRAAGRESPSDEPSCCPESPGGRSQRPVEGPPPPPPPSLSPPSHSFTWLCGHVHRNILSKFTGQAVELFDEEFRHLYASSKPVLGLKSPGLAEPLQPRAGHSAPPGRLSGSSRSASDPFSSPSTGSNPQNRSLSVSSGPGSPLAPNPPPPPRFQLYHGLCGALSPQARFSPRPHDGLRALYSDLHACRPLQLQFGQLGLVPRVAHVWRPFLQAPPHF